VEEPLKDNEPADRVERLTSMRSMLMSIRIQRTFVALLIVVFPILYLLNSVLRDPEIEVLSPSIHGEWVLHPIQTIHSSRRGEVSDDVVFKRDFTMQSSQPLRLNVQAFRRMRVELNGMPVPFDETKRNWKSAIEVNLTPFLQPGENQLRIRVHNEAAVPAILVRRPESLRTPDEWQAAIGPNFEQFVQTVTAHRSLLSRGSCTGTGTSP
jgi:hypothetical protein